jgi:hypothetical protein
VIPPPAVLEIPRVDSIKALGVTVSRRFSVSQHVDAVLAGCAQTLFALRTLRQHGMPDSALRAAFQATVESKMSNAASAWWGYTSAADRGRFRGLPPPVRFVWIPRRVGSFIRSNLCTSR